ncbi:hypothetical protein [Mycolicibacterium hippocampi]|uniref:Uncharacterized protein n=1 Tax=Mycolicibacterium hippocampi TaxID=659824 RepID=A0A850PUD0_9MYCO|nr:hypothetical protein [Mycolicibacterium hippocampi]NVN51614.1 hypothetical protein [Mycolicibacterium hippocampi]
MNSNDGCSRTPEEHMAEVADATLDRLGLLANEVRYLSDQLTMLGSYVLQDRVADSEVGHNLMLLASAARMLCAESLSCDVREIRDLLPGSTVVPDYIGLDNAARYLGMCSTQFEAHARSKGYEPEEHSDGQKYYDIADIGYMKAAIDFAERN